MSVEWKKLLSKTENGCDMVMSLKKIPEGFKLEELIQDNLWVAHNFHNDEYGGCWMDFAIFEFNTEDDDGVVASILVYGMGPAKGSLRECRHTYWGEDGYIFYPRASNIKAALTWLEKYYDLS